MPSAILSGSARRYADAAFEVARESGDFDAWLDSLNRLSAPFAQPDVQTALTSPTVTPAEKRAVLEQIVPNLPPHVRNFVSILAERDRVGNLPDIAVAFRERVNEHRGVLTADVVTAVPLDAETERLVAQRLGAYLRHDPDRLAIRARVDPEIIGGVVAQVGDTLIDDSVRGRIDRLRRVLAPSRA